jgi:glycosyltransferase involved in cell wall biosynthesis
VQISVIIPHLNQPAHLARCLASLMAGQRRPDEVFVVDNGSSVLPEAVCAAYPGVRLLSEPTPGPGPARNTGIAASSGDVLAFIDADCLADPPWLAVAAREMADPAAQILGGDVRIALKDPRNLSALEAYESIFAYRMDRYIAREGFTGTGNLVIRRAIYDAVGPFAGIGVAEDRDWGRRATAKGYKIRYVADMKAYHPARSSFAEIFRKWDRQTAHDYAQGARGAKGKLKWLLKTLAMPLSVIAHAPQVFASPRIDGLASRFRAVWALFIVRMYRAGLMARLLAGADGARLSGSWNRK